MSPESSPELTALQEIAAQKGPADYTTVMAAQCAIGFNRHINPFKLIRQGLQ